MSARSKRDGCRMTAVPGYTGQMWQGKKLGKICTDDLQEIAFAKQIGEQIRAAKLASARKAA